MRKKSQKIIVYFLVILMVVSQRFAVGKGSGTITSQAATVKMANLVLFVDFQDTDHSKHSDTLMGECFLKNYETTLKLFDGDSSVNTGMAQYLDTISYGQFGMVNIFPQYDSSTGGIVPFTAAMNASQYVDDGASVLLSEAIAQLEAKNLITSDMDLDLNDDGVVDNITLVVAYTDTDSEGNDIFVSHKNSVGGALTLGDLEVGNYNLVTESGAYMGTQQSGLLIHEFMHSLGYPDLYKVGGTNENTGIPVGRWDIMASNSYRLQYPLAYLRSHYTGWFNIPTITEDVKNYSLYSASAATSATKDNQALILKTDYSDTEFFVVEYRYTANEYMSTEYDNYVYGSGLIVYRVNTKRDKNIAGETDLIYVFRPGDSYNTSGNEACGGDITASYLSAESGRTSYGTSDYEATLFDGAITYSDGTNSGIVISNVGSATGDTITFDVSFGDGGESIGGFWNTESTKASSGLSMVDSCMDDEGNIYVVACTKVSTNTGANNSFDVYSYNKTGSWSKLGQTVNLNSGYHKIVKLGDELYVACTDYTNARINLYKYNNSWQKVYTSSHAADEFDIVADNGKIYIAYNTPYSLGSASEVYCETYSSGTVASYGVANTGSYLCNPIINMYNGEPVIVTRDVFANPNNKITVSKYSSGTKQWQNQGNTIYADSCYAKIYGNTLYLMKNGDGKGNYEESYVYGLDLSDSSSTWEQLGANTFTDNSAVPMSMFFDGDAIYITYQNGEINSQDVYVKTLVNNKWKAVGTKVTRDGILDMSGNVYDKTIYLVYGDTVSGITIKTHAYEENADSVGGGNSGGTTGGNTGSTTGGNSGGTTGGTVKPFVAPDINVSYRTHIQSFGWENNWKENGAMSGTSGLAKRLEGINITVSSDTACPELDLGIQYTTHCQSYGWLPWSADGDMNGTEGEAKRLEAIKIQLTGEHASYYDVYYRVHAQSYGWLGWAKDGEPAGTAGYGKRLEGIQIVVVKKDESFNRQMGAIDSKRVEAFVAKEGSSPVVNYSATSNENPVIPGADTANITYRTHVQSYGWQGWKYNGQMSGTSGKAKRLEGINIRLTNKDYEGGIVYTTHVQSYGWQGNPEDVSRKGWMKDGQMSGTSGEAKRLEAICIALTGEMSEHYDIYYRVHAQSYGWLGWAKNGAPAGTAGYAKRLEGIQIVLVPKGNTAPTNYAGIVSKETSAYIEK